MMEPCNICCEEISNCSYISCANRHAIHHSCYLEWQKKKQDNRCVLCRESDYTYLTTYLPGNAEEEGPRDAAALLEEAITADNYDECARLIALDPTIVNSPQCPIIVAARNNKRRILKLLIEKGADVNAKSPAMHYTALMWACENGHSNIVELLLEAGADVNLRDMYGTNALRYAIEGDNPKDIIVAMLLHHNPQYELYNDGEGIRTSKMTHLPINSMKIRIMLQNHKERTRRASCTIC